jgi:hypothetical protein
LLNDCLSQLTEIHRSALVLRFFEKKSIEEVGGALGTNESATKMRLARALEELRDLFRQRGVALPTTHLAATLSTMTISAAPAGLASAVVSSVLLKQTSIITKGTLLIMPTKGKTAIAAAVVLLLCGGTTALLLHRSAQFGGDAETNIKSPQQDQSATPFVVNTSRDQLNEARKQADLALTKTTSTQTNGNSVRIMKSRTVSLGGGKKAVISPATGESKDVQPPASRPEYREAK